MLLGTSSGSWSDMMKTHVDRSFNVDFWLILGLLLGPLGHLLELLGAPWEPLGGFLRSSWVLLVIH